VKRLYIVVSCYGITLILLGAAFVTSISADEPSVETVTSEPVTIFWSESSFALRTPAGVQKIAIPKFNGLFPHGTFDLKPHIPDLPILSFQEAVSRTPGKGQQDVSYCVVLDLDGNEIRLPKGEEVKLQKITITIKLDGKESRIVVWKRSK
jgi:hypothetical protein